MSSAAGLGRTFLDADLRGEHGDGSGGAGAGPGQAVQRAGRDGRGRARRRPAGRGRRGLRLPRPQRRRQVHDRADAHDAAVDHVGHRAGGRASTSPPTPTRSAAGSASRSRRPGSTRARPAASCSSCRAGCSASRPPRPRARAEELLELVELEDAADRRIKGYSGGMKRRLDLASALVHEPEVLFLDEPTTGLDPASRLTVWDEVRRINERGTTVFLTTQYLEEADQLCDRLAIIDDGRIVREGTPAQLKADLREREGLASEPDARRRVPRRDRPHPRPRRRRGAGGVGMSAGLGARTARAARGAGGRPRRCCPTLFIPLFFLVVNVGQAAKIFPSAVDRRSSTARATAPSSCRARCCSPRRSAPPRCSSSRTSRAATSTSCARRPVPRTAIVLGRLIAELVKGVLIATAIVRARADLRRSRSPAACSASCCSSR